MEEVVKAVGRESPQVLQRMKELLTHALAMCVY